MPSSQCYQGKYQQLELIGKGKCGIIYRIKSLSDGKQYVAKHISLDQIEQNVAKKQLQIIQKLRHPYIVQYIDSFTSNDDFIIIMEYCKQKDLAHHIELMKSKNKHFNQNLVVTWMFQLVLGIQFIHSKNILHRDIKPQNVFIDENLNIKIGDFGISKVLASTGQHCKTMIGTPYYLAPQICSEQKYTSKADIWSLGCVIYQICSLQRPFKTKGGIFQLIEQIKIGKISQLPTVYSEDLRKLVMKMMTRDQSKRPNTTQLLKDPVLVDLMIKNSSSMSLKKQYSKDIDRPSTLTDSFIDKQTSLVHQQLRQFQDQVKAKMQGLKKKQINGGEVDEHYIELKNKMQDIQKAINKAFGQLKKKTGNKNQIKKSNEMLSSNNSSCFTDSSDMTIVESVVIGQKKDSKNSARKSQSNISAQSASYESVPIIGTTNNLNLSGSSIMLVESQELKNSSKFGKTENQSLKMNSKLSSIKLDQSESLDQTLMSQYQKTVKQSVLAKQTMNKLQFLQKTLSQNPDAILNGSLLNFTLTMSEEQLKRSLKFGKSNPTNSLSMKLKNQQSLDDSINFDLTKRESESPKQKAFMKKKEGNKLQKSSQNKMIEVPKITENIEDDLDQYYNQDFEQYDQHQEDDDSLDISRVGTAKQRRKSQLNTIISFYQQTLQQIDNQSEMNQTLSPTQKVKNKYPLAMSQIKQQNGESGSILSRNNNSNNNSNNNNSLGF